MEKKDLIEYSPVRVFDNNTKASLKSGEMGLITAKKGLGKTSILVQFGIDSLLNDKQLVHVSFDQHSSNVISWYSSILAEIAKKKCFNNMAELNEEIVKNRTILNFNQEAFTLPKVVKTLTALNEGGVKINSIVVDGLDLAGISTEDLDCFASFIKAENMTAWFSYTSEASTLSETLDDNKIAMFTTVAHLAATGTKLSLEVLKNGEGTVSLDSKTSLMVK